MLPKYPVFGCRFEQNMGNDIHVQLNRERHQSALAAGSGYSGGTSATVSDWADDVLGAGIVEIDAGHIESQ
jgi:hypothetical protein